MWPWDVGAGVGEAAREWIFGSGDPAAAPPPSGGPSSAPPTVTISPDPTDPCASVRDSYVQYATCRASIPAQTAAQGAAAAATGIAVSSATTSLVAGALALGAGWVAWKNRSTIGRALGLGRIE